MWMVLANRQKPPYYFYSDLNPPKKRKIGKCKKQPYYFILVPVPFKSRKDYVNIGMKNVQTKISEIGARIESLKEPQKIQKRYSLECIITDTGQRQFSCATVNT